MVVAMNINAVQNWWLRIKILAIVLLIIVAILSFSYDRAEGAMQSAGWSQPVQTTTATMPAVPRTTSVLLCGALLAGLAINQKFS